MYAVTLLNIVITVFLVILFIIRIYFIGTGNWEIRDRPQFTHPVHFGGSVNPGVSEGGTVESCHVVTPAGEDLALTTAVNYPNIIRSTGNLCSVVIENITQDMLGPWLIYGTFNSILRRTVVRLPLVFNLFGKFDLILTVVFFYLVQIEKSTAI